MTENFDELDYLDAIARSAQEAAEAAADVKLDAERIAKTCEGLERRGEAINQAAAVAAKAAVAEALEEWQGKSLKAMAAASAVHVRSLKAQVEEQKKEAAKERRAAMATTCALAAMLVLSAASQRLLAQQAAAQIDAANQALTDAGALIEQVNAQLGAALPPVSAVQANPITALFGTMNDIIFWGMFVIASAFIAYQVFRCLFK